MLEIPFTMIAPQHGSIIKDKETMRYVFEVLANLKGVGIDGVIKDDHMLDLDKIKQRFR
jgi:hypothetical protein